MTRLRVRTRHVSEGKGEVVALTVRPPRADGERLHQLAVAEGPESDALRVNAAKPVLLGFLIASRFKKGFSALKVKVQEKLNRPVIGSRLDRRRTRAISALIAAQQLYIKRELYKKRILY